MPEVAANGVRLNVVRLGDSAAVPVVFLHGLAIDNLASWYFTVATRVAETVPVILYDYRGHGRSEAPRQGYDVETLVTDLAELLNALDVPRAQLCGISFGGQLALAFAARFPDRVERIALVEGHIGAIGWNPRMVDGLQGRNNDPELAQRFIEWLSHTPPRTAKKLLERAWWLVNQTTLVEDMRRSPGLSDEDFRRIACPVFAIYGERSDVLPDVRRAAGLLPNCELEVMDGCTHAIMWEQTEHVRHRLAQWCGSSAGVPIESPPR